MCCSDILGFNRIRTWIYETWCCETNFMQNSAAGNWTRVFRVAGGNINHYTTTDMLVCNLEATIGIKNTSDICERLIQISVEEGLNIMLWNTICHGRPLAAKIAIMLAVIARYRFCNVFVSLAPSLLDEVIHYHGGKFRVNLNRYRWILDSKCYP